MLTVGCYLDYSGISALQGGRGLVIDRPSRSNRGLGLERPTSYSTVGTPYVCMYICINQLGVFRYLARRTTNPRTHTFACDCQHVGMRK